MKVIELDKGQAAIVDDEDFESLAQYRWFFSRKGYVTRRITKDGKRILLMMHRVIMGATHDQQVDHKNMNRLDNRRENLRFATRSQNGANSKARSSNRLGIKGVCARHGKFTAQINSMGKNTHLGTFDTAEEASAAYFSAAVKLHGEFARAN